MITLNYEKINLPELLKQAQALPQEARLAQTPSGLVYADISDAYIHQLFPILHKQNPQVTKPRYFANGGIGAHISVAYPNEKPTISKHELAKVYQFHVYNFVRARIANKDYYVLLVTAPALIRLRKTYGLPDKLDFKGHAIDLHITIANEQ